ncbi:MAG TPA: N-acetyl-1-D-myo-inositol-2-amino-2-deoxy-alpha-D-glucopyranoside deacetylase [Propionibacteriaceae bacterium]|nr:N-acetyl-1-D-myo-inositol-2-amino-2-deoxy-alpha-D-glucopyranoside deacetylase [Propionibacteriaceae bacterium]
MSSDVTSQPARRLMLVHAHPDDETINNGVTMAKYVSEDAAVCLVTCTLGEEGEVLVEDLAHLAPEQNDDLGAHRLGELKLAMEILGVTDFIRLGGDGRYRDSGMAYAPDGRAIARDVLREGIFWTADLLDAANELVPVIRDRRPQVLITYDQIGNYGHPDHVQAHRVAMYATQLAGVPSYRQDLGEPWTVARVFWCTMSKSRMLAGIQALRDAGDMETFKGFDPDGPLSSLMSDDADISVEIDGTPWVAQKVAAMQAHATQITPDGPFFAGADVLGDARWAHEYYRLAVGVPLPKGEGWADDLFAGLT